MKRLSKAAAMLALALCLLTVSALADSGPKPQLVVRVVNGPAEPYYLDLLAEGEYEGDAYDSGPTAYNGLNWSYSDEELAALDGELLDALRAAVPEGWHACTAEGSNTGIPMWGQLYAEDNDMAGNPLHTFSYMGVPETYRILMVTASGDVFCSDVLRRAALQGSATVDWAAGTASVPPTWAGYVLQFFATLLPTLAIEGALLAAFGYRQRRSWMTFLAVNLVTQGALAVWMSVSVLQNGVNWFVYIMLFLPAELIITIGETVFYRLRLTEHSRGRAVAYGLAANLFSALLGYFLAEPVWQFIVSIS